MPLDNAARDGKPDAEAAGRPGGIRAVKAVEQLIQFLPIQVFAAVGGADDHTLFILFQRKGDRRALRRVFDGVIQQDGDQLPEGVFVPVVFQFRRNGKLQLMPVGKGIVPEGFRRFAYRFAEREPTELQRRFLLIHAGERHQRVYQVPQLFGLRLRLVVPFIFPGFHFQHLQAGGDHRNRRFQLVAGIGDKLLLPLRGPDHRIDGPAGQQRHDQIHARDAEQHCRKGQYRRRPHRADFIVAVQKDRHPAVFAAAHHIVPVSLLPAKALAVRQRGLQVLLGVLLGHGCNVPQVGLQQRSLPGIAQHKIPGGKRRFRRKGLFRLCPGLAAVRNCRHRSLIAADDLQHLCQAGIHRKIVGDIHNEAQRQHHRRYGKHGNADEAFAQLFDHCCSSRR